MTWVDFDVLKGQTFDKVVVNKDHDTIRFISENGPSYSLHHDQDCCEYVYIESIDGDIEGHLPGEMILDAYESSNDASQDEFCSDDSCTWSFYVIRTMHDTFTIRFFGSSNGWYSETADLHVMESYT